MTPFLPSALLSNICREKCFFLLISASLHLTLNVPVVFLAVKLRVRAAGSQMSWILRGRTNYTARIKERIVDGTGGERFFFGQTFALFFPSHVNGGVNPSNSLQHLSRLNFSTLRVPFTFAVLDRFYPSQPLLRVQPGKLTVHKNKI